MSKNNTDSFVRIYRGKTLVKEGVSDKGVKWKIWNLEFRNEDETYPKKIKCFDKISEKSEYQVKDLLEGTLYNVVFAYEDERTYKNEHGQTITYRPKKVILLKKYCGEELDSYGEDKGDSSPSSYQIPKGIAEQIKFIQNNYATFKEAYFDKDDFEGFVSWFLDEDTGCDWIRELKRIETDFGDDFHLAKGHKQVLREAFEYLKKDSTN